MRQFKQEEVDISLIHKENNFLLPAIQQVGDSDQRDHCLSDAQVLTKGGPLEQRERRTYLSLK